MWIRIKVILCKRTHCDKISSHESLSVQYPSQWGGFCIQMDCLCNMMQKYVIAFHFVICGIMLCYIVIHNLIILLQVLSKSFYTLLLLPSWCEFTHYHYLRLDQCTTQWGKCFYVHDCLQLINILFVQIILAIQTDDRALENKILLKTWWKFFTGNWHLINPIFITVRFWCILQNFQQPLLLW